MTVTLSQSDTHRIDATCARGLLAWAVQDQYGWGVHTRVSTGVATVRVDASRLPWLTTPQLRDTAVRTLHGVATRRAAGVL
jgi:hypothetical protein